MDKKRDRKAQIGIKSKCINPVDSERRYTEFGIWLAGFAFFTFVLPIILIIALPQNHRGNGVAVLAAVPIIEYLAISVGIGLGINPISSFFLTMFPCIGILLLVFGFLGFLSDSSQAVTKFLKKTQRRIEKYPRLKKYGIVSNFLFVIILGVYIAPGISFILGWSRIRSVIFMACGISFITTLIGLGTMGIIDIFFV